MISTCRRSRFFVFLASGLLTLASVASFAAASASSSTVVRQVRTPGAVAPPASEALEVQTRVAPALHPRTQAAGIGATGAPQSTEALPDRFIVVFKEAALASYDGSVAGYARPEKLPGRARLDVKSARARSYVAYLEARQGEHETRISQVLGRSPEVTYRMQHALNAIVVNLSATEAEAVARLPEVLLVDPVRDVPMDTDVGPAFIGSTPFWNGTIAGASGAVQGEGMVIGDIDSGINFGSPSFAAVDPIDGYAHVNPLGAGTVPRHLRRRRRRRRPVQRQAHRRLRLRLRRPGETSAASRTSARSPASAIRTATGATRPRRSPGTSGTSWFRA